MKSHIDKLIYMANQIALNLGAMKPDDAALTLADHIGDFWDPRMKALIFAHLETGGEGLSPVALAGLTRLRDGGQPAPQTQATEFASAHGTGHCDAG